MVDWGLQMAVKRLATPEVQVQVQAQRRRRRLHARADGEKFVERITPQHRHLAVVDGQDQYGVSEVAHYIFGANMGEADGARGGGDA